VRLAALSDIHSNVFALEATISDATSRGVDLMVNLGDIFYGPIAPKATYDLLMTYDFVTIRGNQDRQIHEATAEEIKLNPTLRFVIDDLGPKPVDWMRSLPFDKQFNDEIYLCHGSPADDMAYLLENIEAGYPRLRTDGEIIEMLHGQRSALILCGHTHLPRTVCLSTGQLVVNPGSVGLPAYTDDAPVAHSMENHCPHASYAILEDNKDGWTIEHIKVPYNFKHAAEEAKKRQRNDWAHFLATGKGL
jgi:predicted phosphodiesterase